MPPKVTIMPMLSNVHRMRFAKNKVLGMSIESIAKEERVKEDTIKNSISLVESYRAMHTFSELEASEIEIILFNKDLEKLALRNGLMATNKEKFVDTKTQKEIVVETPDYDIQLRAVEILSKKAEGLISAHAKGKAVAPQHSTTVQIGVNAGSSGGTVGIVTFEDRLREIKRKQAQLKEQQSLPASSTPIDVEVEEVRPNWEGDEGST